MGTSKTEAFTEEEVAIAEMAKAMGHPARVAIIKFLLEKNACVCGDIVNELPLSQSTVSQHLKALKQIGLIAGTIDGPSVCYCINQAKWEEMRHRFDVLFSTILSSNSNC